MMAPIVHGLEAQYGEGIIFSYLDIDDPGTGELKQLLGYRVQPHFFLLDPHGKVLKEWLGYVSGEELQAALNQVSQ